MGRPALIARRTKKMKITRSESYIINAKYMGEEPVFDASVPLSQHDYASAFNWYNYMCDTNDAKQYTIEYLNFLDRKEDIIKFKKVPDVFVNLTASWIARLLMNGYVTPEGSMDFFEKKLEESLSHVKNDTAVVLKFNIQDRIKEKTQDLIGEIESKIDTEKDFSLYDYLKRNSIPATYCSEIVIKYSVILDELLEAADNKDEQLKEAYKHMNKKELDNRILFINKLISDAEKYGSNTKKLRITKPRPVKIENVLRTFKYQKEDKGMKLASIKPEKILGAQELWTYNTKYKTLTVYRADGPKGLNIKGTSIIGYNDKDSTGKSIGRKTEEYVNKIMNDSKTKNRKIFDEISTAVVFSSRTSDNTILLKVS